MFESASKHDFKLSFQRKIEFRKAILVVNQYSVELDFNMTELHPSPRPRALLWQFGGNFLTIS